LLQPYYNNLFEYLCYEDIKQQKYTVVVIYSRVYNYIRRNNAISGFNKTHVHIYITLSYACCHALDVALL